MTLGAHSILSPQQTLTHTWCPRAAGESGWPLLDGASESPHGSEAAAGREQETASRAGTEVGLRQLHSFAHTSQRVLVSLQTLKGDNG